MKRAGFLLLVMLLMMVNVADAQRGRRGRRGAAPGERFSAQGLHGPYVSGAFNLFLQNATGTAHDAQNVYDWAADQGFNDNGVLTGFGWDSKTNYGIQGALGYRVNPFLGVEGSYCYYFQKTGTATDGSSTADTEWNQRNLRAVANLFPVRSGQFTGFHFLVGLDWMLFDAKQTLVQNNGLTASSEDSGNALGFLLGAGYDYRLTRRAEFYANAIWSSTTYKNPLFGEPQTLEYDVDFGGWAFDFGLRFYLSRQR